MVSFYFDDFLAQCSRLRDMGSSFVIATVTSVKNSTPQDQGAKMIVSKEGIEFGTIGGGALEKKCIKLAQESLLSSEDNLIQHIDFNLNKDLGMTCGGEASILFEKVNIASTWNVVIFGAGHVSQALVRTLQRLDCKITCIDTRKDWLDKLPTSSKITRKYVNAYTDVIEEIPLSAFIVIMTSGHNFDLPILRTVLQKKSFPYIGVIGAKSKRKKLDIELKSEGIEGNYYCPIGEPIGSNNLYEIAISIVAQLLKFRSKKYSS